MATCPSAPTKITPSQLKRFQQKAKKLKKQLNIKHTEALDLIAKKNGFLCWKSLLDISMERIFLEESNIQLPLDSELLDNEVSQKQEQNNDTPNDPELLLARNKQFLVKEGIEYSLFEPTETGLKKSILDATQPVRTHFKITQFHNYEVQGQGPLDKVIAKAFLVSPDGIKPSRMSLYRPKTKQGDPRMWFGGLPSFALPKSQIAIIIFEGAAYLLDLTKDNLAKSFETNDHIGQFLHLYIRTESATAEELLNKLRVLAKSPIPALGKGSTAIGMAVEAALGIPANSSKKPDYKGIELKSGRGGSNRSTLFAQVASWPLSPCKSSREILDMYGYERGDDFKLYCTISTQKANSQGLYFEYDKELDRLYEKHSSGNDVAVWEGHILRNRLQEKHAETFWIQADSEMIDGVEHFHLKSIVHTRSPLLNQLMPLIESGVITMDHLIKRKGGDKPKVSEKGPLFKMDKRNLPLLFPAPVKYSLVN